jgi:cytochrome c biogenesis protein
MVTAAPTAKSNEAQWSLRLSIFASVKLTVLCICLIAVTVLVGAWCPQEAQVGRDKVFETFGPQVGQQLIKYGISDIFHTPFFLGLIGLLTVNMVACSMQRVFPKVKSLSQPMPFLAASAIEKMSVHWQSTYKAPPDMVADAVYRHLKQQGYTLARQNSMLTGHWGKVGRMAATITHIGLLTLLAGVTVTSWTGFSGFQPVPKGGDLSFDQSEHSKLWIGKLPSWHVKVEATRREDYASGDAKQWYSTLAVMDAHNRVLKRQEISVNSPLSYGGVDIYQSSWALGDIAISFNDNRVQLPLRQMGPVIHAAFLPLDPETIIMFSVHGQEEPVRVFAKTPSWPAPRILTALEKGTPAMLGNVKVTYDELIPVTGLQYKCDPGLPITFMAFGFIMTGVCLAAMPFRQLWVCVTQSPDGQCTVTVGGMSRKAQNAFARKIQQLNTTLDREFPTVAEKEKSCQTCS